MKHLMNLAKAFVAAAVVIEGGGRVAAKLPASLIVKGHDTRPVAAGGAVLMGVLTIASFVGGKKVAGKVIPAV